MMPLYPIGPIRGGAGGGFRYTAQTSPMQLPQYPGLTSSEGSIDDSDDSAAPSYSVHSAESPRDDDTHDRAYGMHLERGSMSEDLADYLQGSSASSQEASPTSASRPATPPEHLLPRFRELGLADSELSDDAADYMSQGDEDTPRESESDGELSNVTPAEDEDVDEDYDEVPHPPQLPGAEEERLQEVWPLGHESFSIFLCPVTHDVMRDPVVSADGYTYERSAIARWFETSRKSPVTGQTLPHTELVPNHSVRTLLKTLIDMTADEKAPRSPVAPTPEAPKAPEAPEVPAVAGAVTAPTQAPLPPPPTRPPARVRAPRAPGEAEPSAFEPRASNASLFPPPPAAETAASFASSAASTAADADGGRFRPQPAVPSAPSSEIGMQVAPAPWQDRHQRPHSQPQPQVPGIVATVGGQVSEQDGSGRGGGVALRPSSTDDVHRPQPLPPSPTAGTAHGHTPPRPARSYQAVGAHLHLTALEATPGRGEAASSSPHVAQALAQDAGEAGEGTARTPLGVGAAGRLQFPLPPPPPHDGPIAAVPAAAGSGLTPKRPPRGDE